jgi:hypothetical protein
MDFINKINNYYSKSNEINLLKLYETKIKINEIKLK